jgi:putative glutamine amidotransferase
VSTPLVLTVGYYLRPGKIQDWDYGAFAMPELYVEALSRAGATTVLLPQTEGLESEAVLDSFSGLLLVGGGDIDPRAYGAERHGALYGVDARRDTTEMALIRTADQIGLPTLAICRGPQVMNVAFGGTLHQHLPDLPGLLEHGAPAGGRPTSHDVKIAESSRLAAAVGENDLVCESHHHQGLDLLGEGLVAVGWTGDGLVEAVERERGWMVGVQWHPERTAASDRAQQAIFDAFVEEVRSRAR